MRKGFYANEYMDDWEKFNKTSLLEKKFLTVFLNMEDITDAGYTHAKRICKDFEMKKVCKYHDLYVQSDTLLLADVFNNFQNMCLEIDGFDSAHFLSTPVLAWRAGLKKTNVKVDLLADVDMLLMVEKSIWRRNILCYLLICES